MIAVLLASNVAPLLLSQSNASLIIDSTSLRLLCAVGPETQAVKSSTNAIAPLLLSIRRWTKSALKKRNRIGDSGEPCERPACDNSRTSDDSPLIRIVAVRFEQNASTHRSSFSGMPRAFILWSSLSLHTPLYAPLTSKL